MRKMTKFLCIDDYENYAINVLSKPIGDYYKGGAEDEQTLRDNRKAFNRLRIRPNFLRDVSSCDLSTTLLGNRIEFPICVAPTAAHRLVNADGEVATARACGSLGTVMTLATISTSSLEEVSESALNTIKWFQTFIYTDKDRTRDLVKRAEKSGYKAIVLTVDCPIHGNRINASRNKFEFPPHLRLSHFEMKVESNPMQSMVSYFNPSTTWKDVEWLKTITRLPIVLKGILTKEDALLAVKYGVSAIIVSNHGGRQLNGSPATIEALPEVVKAVQNRCEVYMDGGVRTGTDVLKALALGAKAVFIGRPILWGLTHGQKGVENVLGILKNELEMALRLCGASNLNDLRENKSIVVTKNFYKSNL